MNRRSFLKLSALGVAGAGVAIRTGRLFSAPKVWTPPAGITSGFALAYLADNHQLHIASHLEMLRELMEADLISAAAAVQLLDASTLITMPIVIV